MYFITETKRMGPLGSMKPFSEGEPGSLGHVSWIGFFLFFRMRSHRIHHQHCPPFGRILLITTISFRPLSTWICFLVDVFHGFDPMGFITIKAPTIWEKMFWHLFIPFFRHRGHANPSVWNTIYLHEWLKFMGSLLGTS